MYSIWNIIYPQIRNLNHGIRNGIVIQAQSSLKFGVAFLNSTYSYENRKPGREVILPAAFDFRKDETALGDFPGEVNNPSNW
jgi:hypothetical protein